MNLGIFCGCITMVIAYILAQTMHIMQDKPEMKKEAFHSKNTPLCGGIGIFIAYIVVVLGGIEIPNIHYNNTNQTIDFSIGYFYEYGGLHLYLACCIILCSGIIKDIYGKTKLWLMLCMQICGFCIFTLLFYFLNIQHEHNLIFTLLLCCIFLFLTTNSINTIDGINGNAVLYSIFILLSLCFVAYQTQSNFIGFAASILLGILFVFLLFNYPFGKMFLGDSGAFLLGFCIGGLLLLSMLHYKINAWYCYALFLYPICAILSSLTLNIFFIKKNPKQTLLQALWRPHTIHLHYLLWQYCRNTTAFVINGCYACFIVFITYYYQQTSMIIIASISFCIFYILCFTILWKRKAIFIR